MAAAFLVKNRWVEKEVKVKAGGLVGALTKGVREAKLQARQPRNADPSDQGDTRACENYEALKQ